LQNFDDDPSDAHQKGDQGVHRGKMPHALQPYFRGGRGQGGERPREARKSPEHKDRKIAEQEFQRSEIEKSIECLRGLGLGTQGA
jgi:hypothetical protein